jgi:hypothetical protein
MLFNSKTSKSQQLVQQVLQNSSMPMFSSKVELPTSVIPFNNIEYFTVFNKHYRLIPHILTIEQYNEEYEHFLEFIKLWQLNIINPIKENETSLITEYPDLLMWIEYVDLRNVFTEEFDNELKKIFVSSDDLNQTYLIKWYEFLSALYIHYHAEFLDIIQGKAYKLFHDLFNINFNQDSSKSQIDTVHLTMYNWKWIIPYYLQAVPQENQLGYKRYHHLRSLQQN